MTTINDGQLDEARRLLTELRRVNAILHEVCARRMELLKRVAEGCVFNCDLFYVRVEIARGDWDAIEAETDEQEGTG